MDLNDACRPQITDIAVVLNGDKPDDGPSADTGRLAHVEMHFRHSPLDVRRKGQAAAQSSTDFTKSRNLSSDSHYC